MEETLEGVLNSFRAACKDSRVFLSPNIPPTRARGAVAAYARGVNPSDILLLYDDTFLGGGGEGLIITRYAVFGRSAGRTGVKVLLRDVDAATVEPSGWLRKPGLVVNGTTLTELHLYAPQQETPKKLAELLTALRPFGTDPSTATPPPPPISPMEWAKSHWLPLVAVATFAIVAGLLLAGSGPSGTARDARSGLVAGARAGAGGAVTAESQASQVDASMTQDTESTGDSTAHLPRDTGLCANGRPQKGKADAMVTVVRFESLQSGASENAQSRIDWLIGLYRDDVRWVWVNNPSSFGSEQMPAAIAAMAAARQGKFWEMHEKIMGNQGSLSATSYARWAADLGLDTKQFDADLKDSSVEAQLNKDKSIAAQLDVGIIPVFFVDGKKVAISELSAEIDAALVAAKQLAASGLAGEQLRLAAHTARNPSTGAKIFYNFVSADASAKTEGSGDPLDLQPGADLPSYGSGWSAFAGLPSPDDLWFLESRVSGCDKETTYGIAPGDDEFERNANEKRRSTLRTELSDRLFVLHPDQVEASTGEYNFKTNSLPVLVAAKSSDFAFSGKAPKTKCEGEIVSWAYCLGYCIGSDSCSSEHSCSYDPDGLPLAVQLSLPPEDAKRIKSQQMRADVVVRIKGVSRHKKCIVERFDCDDLHQAPERDNAGAGPIVLVDVVAARVTADNKLVYQFDKGVKGTTGKR